MAQIVFQQKSLQEAYNKMEQMGFTNYGCVGFTSFSIRQNFGLDSEDIYHQQMNGDVPKVSIVGESNYHCEDTIKNQYNTNGRAWQKS